MSSTPTIQGVSHIDLTVTDLDTSEAFYADLFGMTRVLDGRNDDHHFSSRYLLHPDTMLIVGLVCHDEPGDASFDERSVGLDHLAFAVPTADELAAWVRHLDERGIERGDITEGDLWDVLVFRDPDHIQLELFHMKPQAAALLT